MIAIRFLETRGPPGNGVNATVMVSGITHIVVLYTSVKGIEKYLKIGVWINEVDLSL